MSFAIYPGSFDPITSGHFDVIQQASKIFDAVQIVVMNNDNKSHLFSVDERLKIIEASIGMISNVSVIGFNGRIEELIKNIETNEKVYNVPVIRGLRRTGDFEYEQTLNEYITNLLGSPVMYFMPNSKNITTSSSFVREVIKMNYMLTLEYMPNIKSFSAMHKILMAKNND
jgi:pantetheine-phosphate adenylyltransferase